MPVIYTDKELPKRKEKDFYETPIEFCRASLKKFREKENPFIEDVLDPGSGTGVWGQAFREVWNEFYLYDDYIGNPPTLVGIELRDIKPNYDYDYWYTANFIEESFADATIFEVTKSWDLIMGNPPYYVGEKFVDKSLNLLSKDGYLLFLLSSSFSESKIRYDKYFNNGLNPKYIWQSVRRINFVGSKGSNPNSYSVFVWKRGWNGPTYFDWLDWNYD